MSSNAARCASDKSFKFPPKDFSISEYFFDGRCFDQHFRRPRATDNYVRNRKVARKIFKTNRAPPDPFGQQNSPLKGAVGHHQTSNALAHKMARHEGANLAGTN